MPLLTRARRVSQGHRCRYVFSRCLRTPEDTKGKEVSNASSSQTRCERTESRRVLTFCTGTTYFLRYLQIEEPDTPSRRAAAAWVRWLTLSTISLERESAKDFFLVQSDLRLLRCKVICPPKRSFAWEAVRLGFLDRPRVAFDEVGRDACVPCRTCRPVRDRQALYSLPGFVLPVPRRLEACGTRSVYIIPFTSFRFHHYGYITCCQRVGHQCIHNVKSITKYGMI